MSDEFPDWLDDFEEFDSLDDEYKEKKTDTRKSNPFSSAQIVVLLVLFLFLCAVCSGVGAVFYLRQNTIPAQAGSGVSTPATSVAASNANTPQFTPTPAPTATSMLPQAKPTAEPSATATYVVSAEFTNKDKIKDILGFVEEWRELSVPQEIPIVFLTRDQFSSQWQDEAFDVEILEAVKKQQEFYIVMGLLEPDVDLVQAAYDSRTDIILGYYTPDEKIMYVIAESVNMFAQEEMTFAHEYVHALQDAHFDLSTIYNHNRSGDALLAARSLPEGDARLVEDLFAMQNITSDQLEYTVYRYLFEDHPELEGVSPALGVFTYFPYTAGEYFAIYLFIEGGFTWDLVNKAYSNPPVSSEQVMHPEKYLAGDMPIDIPMPDLTHILGSDWYELDRDVLGEAGFLVWLYDQIEDERIVTSVDGWGGDSYSLWVDDNGKRVLVEASVWETETDATEFSVAFNQYMDLREGELRTHYAEEGAIFWEHDEDITLLIRSGNKVLIVIAPNKDILNDIRNQFVDFKQN